MKVVDLKRQKPTLMQVLKMASEQNLILKTAQGKEFILAETDDFDREIALMCANESLMELLSRRSKEKKRHSLQEVKKKLRLD